MFPPVLRHLLEVIRFVLLREPRLLPAQPPLLLLLPTAAQVPSGGRRRLPFAGGASAGEDTGGCAGVQGARADDEREDVCYAVRRVAMPCYGLTRDVTLCQIEF